MKCVAFCVAYFNLLEGCLKQEVIMAPNKVEAMAKYLSLPWDTKEEVIYAYAENSDFHISALEI